MNEKIDLDVIEERADKATEGPFESIQYDHGGGRMWVLTRNGGRHLVMDTYHVGDTEFYQHAHKDNSDLHKLVKQQAEMIREARITVEGYVMWRDDILDDSGEAKWRCDDCRRIGAEPFEHGANCILARLNGEGGE